MGTRLLQMTAGGAIAGPSEADKPSSSGEPSYPPKGWNPYASSDVRPQKYSWIGRSQYAAKGVMEDRLPLQPSIPENLVEDDVGVWVTFDVPPGHHLYGMFVPVDRALVPEGVPIQRFPGNVFSQATKPTMDQIARAVEIMQQAEAAKLTSTGSSDQPQPPASSEPTSSDSRPYKRNCNR